MLNIGFRFSQLDAGFIWFDFSWKKFSDLLVLYCEIREGQLFPVKLIFNVKDKLGDNNHHNNNESRLFPFLYYKQQEYLYRGVICGPDLNHKSDSHQGWDRLILGLLLWCSDGTESALQLSCQREHLFTPNLIMNKQSRQIQVGGCSTHMTGPGASKVSASKKNILPSSTEYAG